VDAVDGTLSSPLHLVEGQSDALLLLYHGSSKRPSLSAINASHRTPSQEAAAAGFAHSAERLCPVGESARSERPCKWLERGGHNEHDRRLYSFLHNSPMRQPPAKAAPLSFLAHASLSDLIFTLLPVTPPVLIGHGMPVPYALAALLPVLLASNLVHLACRRCDSPERMGGVAGVNACFLVGLVMASGYIYGTALLPYATADNMLSTYATLVALVGYWYARAHPGTRPRNTAPLGPSLLPRAPMGARRCCRVPPWGAVVVAACPHGCRAAPPDVQRRPCRRVHRCRTACGCTANAAAALLDLCCVLWRLCRQAALLSSAAPRPRLRARR
jgi:hypothetical protein